jgi:hypothetical protein
MSGPTLRPPPPPLHAGMHPCGTPAPPPAHDRHSRVAAGQPTAASDPPQPPIRGAPLRPSPTPSCRRHPFSPLHAPLTLKRRASPLLTPTTSGPSRPPELELLRRSRSSHRRHRLFLLFGECRSSAVFFPFHALLTSSSSASCCRTPPTQPATIGAAPTIGTPLLCRRRASSISPRLQQLARCHPRVLMVS